MILKGINGIKRLAVYVIYDKDGIVDDYITYFLKDLKKNNTEILAVVNGKLLPESREKLLSVVDTLICRENKGYDISAYKEGLQYFGWDKLECYHEVMLINDTLFGPIYPFKEMFDEMDARDLDFWGITKHHSVPHDCFGTVKYGYMPEHIQSSFMVFRNSLIKSIEFKRHWDNLREIHDYNEAVGFHEAIFTKDFGDMGYRWGLYIDTSDIEGYTRYPLMMMSSELVINRRCPVIKKKSFSQNYYDLLLDTVVNATIDTFEYIDKHTDYDVDMIWQNILRVFNMADIKKLMHLNYILPADSLVAKAETDKKPRVALMMHLYYEDLVDYCKRYAMSMPPYTDVYITTTSAEKKSLIEEKFKGFPGGKVEVIQIENRGRDVSSLLVGLRDFVHNYDYICFAHDKKTTQISPYCIGEGFSYKCFENILGTEEYVNNIITTFMENPRLGILTPPPPNHGKFYNIIGTEWASNFQNTASLAHRLKLNVDLRPEKEPIAPLGTMFWFRPEALSTLIDYGWKYSDFPSEPNHWDGTLLHAVERIYPYVAQHNGYYSAWVMSDHYSRIEFTNINFMMRELNSALLEKYFTDNIYDMVYNIRENSSFKWAPSHGFKRAMKKFLPKWLYNCLKKIYHIIKGK